MLAGVQGIEFGYVLCGIIWAVVLGFAVGNYACSLVHRLPRGRLLLDKTPYCGSCGTLLKVNDLFPVISALLLRHRCRYCGAPFPVSHTWTEILVGLLFVLTFLQYNFTEAFVLIVSIGTFLITLAAIDANERQIMGKVLVCVIVFGMLYRVLQDGTIYNFFQGGLFGLIIGVVVRHKEIKKIGHIYMPPPLALLLAAGGICVGSQQMLPFLALFAICYLLGWFWDQVRRNTTRLPLTIPFGFAVTLSLLYPSGLFIPLVP